LGSKGANDREVLKIIPDFFFRESGFLMKLDSFWVSKTEQSLGAWDWPLGKKQDEARLSLTLETGGWGVEKKNLKQDRKVCCQTYLAGVWGGWER